MKDNDENFKRILSEKFNNKRTDRIKFLGEEQNINIEKKIFIQI